MKYILIVGGAGYIGSHMVAYVKRAGYIPIVVDNLSTGHRAAVKNAELHVVDIHDAISLNHVFSKYTFAAVMHFASSIEVSESVRNPAKYYHNNVVGTLNLLDVMRERDVKSFIFSSSAAVYGEPLYTPIDEKHRILPMNPYGRSKWMIEQILADYAASYGLQFAALRYFNAAGADPDGHLAEQHTPETHLIPLVLQVAAGKKSSIALYGNDYQTPDGTCVRDYIHVTDLCDAHWRALNALWQGSKCCTYNLGSGQGYSVQEVIDVARIVTGCDIPLIQEAPREGDPAMLVADASLARRELGWEPKYTDLQTIIGHAWRMHVLTQVEM